jgi:hypothetical protein
MKQKLEAAQEAAAGGSNTEHAQVVRPKKVGNIQAAMSLDRWTYRAFRVSPFFILTKRVGTWSYLLQIDVARFALVAGLSPEIRWSHQDVGKVARVCKMVSALSSYCRHARLTHLIGQEKTQISQTLRRRLAYQGIP